MERSGACDATVACRLEPLTEKEAAHFAHSLCHWPGACLGSIFWFAVRFGRRQQYIIDQHFFLSVIRQRSETFRFSGTMCQVGGKSFINRKVCGQKSAGQENSISAWEKRKTRATQARSQKSFQGRLHLQGARNPNSNLFQEKSRGPKHRMDDKSRASGNEPGTSIEFRGLSILLQFKYPDFVHGRFVTFKVPPTAQ